MDAILGSSKSVRLKIDQKKYRICFEGRKSPPTSARNPDAVCPMPLKSATYRTGELASACSYTGETGNSTVAGTLSVTSFLTNPRRHQNTESVRGSGI